MTDVALVKIRELMSRALALTKEMSIQIYEFKDDVEENEWLLILFDSSEEYLAVIKNIAKLAKKPELKDVYIPKSLIQHVDEGRQPDTWLKNSLVELKEENDSLRKKALGIEDFKKELLTALNNETSFVKDDDELGQLVQQFMPTKKSLNNNMKETGSRSSFPLHHPPPPLTADDTDDLIDLS